MYSEDLFHTLPLSVIYFITSIFVLAALWFGVMLGRRYIRKAGVQKESSIGSAVAATLGLLAFMLAFTFNMTADRFNQRKALLLGEVNAIHTAYLHADFLLPEDGARAKVLLADYADLRGRNRLLHRLSLEEIQEILARSVAIHRELWDLVDHHVAKGYDAGYLRQFVEPMSNVISFHHSREVIGFQYRIPDPIWISLYFMTGLAMIAIGYQFGISRGGSIQVAITLAVTFATVIILIADLDRATEGTLLIDQGPMGDLSRQLKESERARLNSSVPDVH